MVLSSVMEKLTYRAVLSSVKPSAYNIRITLIMESIALRWAHYNGCVAAELLAVVRILFWPYRTSFKDYSARRAKNPGINICLFVQYDYMLAR